jgi:hypothetical protein
MVRIPLLIAMVAGCVFAQQTTQTTAPPMSKDTAVLVNLFKPVYPLLARQANIYGEVGVALTVRQDGTAQAAVESGHPMLVQAALDSAKQSRFECRMCSAPVSYLLVYSFKLTTAGDCCNAFSVPPQVEQEPQLIGPQGRPETHVSIAAEQICLCDPSSVLRKKSRSIKCFYLWNCSLR